MKYAYDVVLNFNDEFIIFYFNKRLMNHLRNIKFNLGPIATGIDKELLSEYNKELEKGAAPNYDNESVYTVLFDWYSRYTIYKKFRINYF